LEPPRDRIKKLAATLAALLAFSTFLPAEDLDWDIEMPFDDTVFPSVVIGLRGFMDADDLGPREFGDPLGMIGVKVTAPADDFEVVVTVDETSYFKTSKMRVVLPEEGKTYTIMPLLRYDVSKLIAHKQRGFDIAEVSVETATTIHSDTRRFDVRSVNDCLLGITIGDEFINTRFLFSAYVNENNPELDRILGHALSEGYVDSFIGYQGTRGDVIRQAKAIYQSLQDLGFKYSSITGASGKSEKFPSQHVRFLSESLATSQANCVDGTVILAALFMKIGLNPVIITVPGHAFVGVYKSTSKEREFLVPIETTVLATSSFDRAVEIATAAIEENEDHFADPGKMSYQIIDVRSTRESGVAPIIEDID
jgi:hypothetical protein